MDLVLVGLPGSGKSAVGRRIATRHRATFIDLDDQIERATGRTIPEIFATDGEATFRAFERAAVAGLGPADPDRELRRVISPGGGAIVDPRNRWTLYRGRVPVWLDVRTEVLAQRLRRSPTVRPLIQGHDPLGRIRALATGRERFYAAAHPVNGVADIASVLGAVERVLPLAQAQARRHFARRRQSATSSSATRIAAAAVDGALRRLGARRAMIVSEPGAWAAFGEGVAGTLRMAGWPVEIVMLPAGEAAKRLTVIEQAARELARHRVERHEPLIAIGGGALGKIRLGSSRQPTCAGSPGSRSRRRLSRRWTRRSAARRASTWPRGRTSCPRPDQPSAIVLDVGALRSLPERQLRAAFGEVVKMGALGDERLFATLERDAEALTRGDDPVFEQGFVAEVVERSAWAKVEVVAEDTLETGANSGRIMLNLGHSVGHALEVADGYETMLHGEAVAYGVRAAVRIGSALGVTPAGRGRRIEALLDRFDLGRAPLPYPAETVIAAMGTDKKHAGGRLRWVLPTADGVVVRDDVPGDAVTEAVRSILAGDTAGTTAGLGATV